MTSVPVFHFAVPFLAKDVSRVERTVNSLIGQSAVASNRVQVRISLVSDEVGLSSPSVSHLDRHDSVELIVESHVGMYSAIADAIEQSSADYFGYLGAGDTLEPQAFDLALENSPVNPRLQPWWCTGYITTRREDGAIVRVTLPYRYRARFFESGIHGSLLPTIQQESTIWCSFLNQIIDFRRLRTFRLAGDYFLWAEFCRYSEPVVIEAVVGSFHWHGDNSSADWASYQAEVAQITRRPTIADRALALIDVIVWALPPRIRLALAPSPHRRFEWPNGPWRQKQ